MLWILCAQVSGNSTERSTRFRFRSPAGSLEVLHQLGASVFPRARNPLILSNPPSVTCHPAYAWGMKDAAERKRDERKRMRKAGFVLRQFWVHPKDWARVAKYLQRIKRSRG